MPVVLKQYGNEPWMVDEWNSSSKYPKNTVRIYPSFSFDPDPTTRHTVWSILFGATFTWLAIYGRLTSDLVR